MSMMESFSTDIIVIGSGIAGLNFALRASEYAKVAIITKDTLETSNTMLAQGGLAAVFSREDSFEEHIKDTLRVGEGLSDKRVVEFVVKNAPEEIINLQKAGVKFDKSNNVFILSREAAHSMPRIVHQSDATGRYIEEALCRNVRKKENITIFENFLAYELIHRNNVCYGVYTLNLKENKVEVFFARAIIIATGGIGQLYKVTTNPSIATADGIAMAFSAGAELCDMEFVQFHPTMFIKNSFLISETVRGEGGILKNIEGERFMTKYSNLAELSSRNVVARACFSEMDKTNSGFVNLDISHKLPEFIKKRFPNIYKTCMESGVDITREPVPVTPTAHYLCGGVLTNIRAETNISGLYAIGECACTMLHGAERLASNSLTEALVFSSQAAHAIRVFINSNASFMNSYYSDGYKKEFRINLLQDSSLIHNMKSKLQGIMWQYAGIIRIIEGLNKGLVEILEMSKNIEQVIREKGINKDSLELRSMCIVSEQIMLSALERKESRGSHFLKDFSERNDSNYIRHFIRRKLC